jgi:transposase-like protein
VKLKERKTAMKNRTGNSTGRKPRLTVVGREDVAGAVRAAFADQGQVLLPILELVENARASIDELMNGAARGFVEQLLVLSAQEVAGAKHPGRPMGEVLWHGSQPGRIVLGERKLALKRPRLRRRAARGGEVAIPVYARLQAEARLGERIRDILVRGVSTRKYAEVLPRMAGTVGIAKSSVSRRFIRASRDALEALMGRRFDELDILAVWIDGIIVGDHHILAAVGVDAEGGKHLLGLAQGSSENARVAKDLLSSLIARGIGPDRTRLFVIDGSKALRAAIEELFGGQAKVQRCRIHKMRNVTERLPKPIAAQVSAVMHAAYKLPEKDGIGKLKQQAAWLKTEYADAAASLLEGLEETFTVNRLKLTPSLMRCLASTNVIENPNGAVRRVTHRVSRYRDAQMALRWTATGFLEAEKSFRKIQGHRQLWVLGTALGRSVEQVDVKSRAA